ncbi:DUF945 domain-containing protein [Campylobacter blaseri]|uniref:DUF945 family protein n=1 Tax=Campylobacter blaseri TaxID=2042961 RepID=UPI0012FFF7BE|nr:DUF945 family protein [Campylobacter blaseri]QKF86743.1 DUF945 domain-containing protein [Campylobacter blaseri]
MKKIVIFLALFVLVYIGGSYYLGLKHSQRYDEIFTQKLPKDIVVKNSHKNGIFKTKNISDVVFSKEYLANILGLNSSDIKEDLRVEISTTIIHPFFSLVSGTKGEGFIKILSYKDIADKFLKDKQIVEYSFEVKGKNNQKVHLQTTQIEYKDEMGEIKFSPIVADIEYISGGISKVNSKQESFKLNFKENDLEFELDDIIYNTVFDEPLKFDYGNLYNLVNSSSEFGFKDFILKLEDKKNGELKLRFSNYNDKSRVNVKNSIVDIKSISSANKLIIDVDNEKIQLNNIKSNISLNNFNKDFYDKLFKELQNNTLANLNEEDLQDFIKLFIEKNPSINLENLSFKYDDKYDFELNFKTGVKKFDLSNPMEGLKNIYLDGKTIFSKDIIDLFLANDTETKEMLVNSQIIKESGDNYEVSFKYDKNQMDVIINDKIGINQFLSTQF